MLFYPKLDHSVALIINSRNGFELRKRLKRLKWLVVFVDREIHEISRYLKSICRCLKAANNVMPNLRKPLFEP